MDLKQILKLAKMIQKFAEIETNNGILITNGELAEGVEVFVEQDGEVVPAPDGDYETEEALITVEGGLVAKIADKAKEEPKAEEEPAEEPAPVEEAEEAPVEEEPKEEAPAEDEKDAKIKELEAEVEALKAENEELKAKLGQAEEELSKPVKTETKMSKNAPLFKSYLK